MCLRRLASGISPGLSASLCELPLLLPARAARFRGNVLATTKEAFGHWCCAFRLFVVCPTAKTAPVERAGGLDVSVPTAGIALNRSRASCFHGSALFVQGDLRGRFGALKANDEVLP